MNNACKWISKNIKVKIFQDKKFFMNNKQIYKLSFFSSHFTST